jgi:phosphate acetyltransferase
MLIPIIVSDAAVNIAPDLDQKRDIVQNAITPCQLWGFQAAILEVPNSNRSIWRKQRSLALATACALTSQKRDR